MHDWIGIGTGILVQLLVAGYVYGRLTEKVAGHAKDIKDHRDSDKRQWEILNNHEGRLGHVEGRLEER